VISLSVAVMLLLIEYCVLSVLLYISFGSEIKLNEFCKTEASSHEPLQYSMGTFLGKVKYCVVVCGVVLCCGVCVVCGVVWCGGVWCGVVWCGVV
jgi:hypothetical protein